MKKIIIVLAFLALTGFIVFTYATRDLAAPSAPVDEVSIPADSAGSVYQIEASSSLATYELDELLRGEPKHVVGTTSEVKGQIEIVNGVVSIGEIVINARTFKTDAEKRDNAVGRYILKSEELANEFITLRNTVISNTSGLVENGVMFTADVTGDLTIAGVTQKTMFRIEGTVGDDGVLRGVAKAIVKRSDFGLKIPELSFIANVSDEVVLTAQIVAPAL